MEYLWRRKNAPKGADISDENRASAGFCRTEILSLDEFSKRYPQAYRRLFVDKRQCRIRFCRAENLERCAAGTFVTSREKKASCTEYFFAFCVTEDRVIFADDQDFVRRVLDKMQGMEEAELASSGTLFFHFLETLFQDDILLFQEYEDRLAGLEERLMNETGGAYENRYLTLEREIFSVRREISSLGIHYRQLSQVGETLERFESERKNEKEAALFRFYAGRSERLSDMVQMMKEYSLQLQEMHQAQVDLRQNEIMKFLTAVTTIFLPLTLVTGWYGMNFEHMPELKQPCGYGAVFVLCVLLTAAEVWVFVKKKWLK